MIKKTIQNIFNFFGFKIIKKYIINTVDFDSITTLLIDTKEPVIFDIGAGKGQSIDRYKKLFPKCKIHSFEPIKHEVDKLSLKYQNDKLVILNNVAVGEKPGNLDFNIAASSGHSSFKNLIPNTTWVKERSKEYNVDSKNYITGKINTKVITLDDYCNDENIQQIDILKIDTQGYEELILKGAKKVIAKQKIDLIELELILGDYYKKSSSFKKIEENLFFGGYRLIALDRRLNIFENKKFYFNALYASQNVYKKII